MTSDPLQTAATKVHHAWVADGLADIGVGLILLLPAFWEWGKTQVNPASTAWQVLNWGMMISIILGPWLMRWLLPRLRNRFLSDRAGYAIPRAAPEHKRKGAVAGGIAAVVGMVIAIWFVRQQPLDKVIEGLIALGSAAILVQAGWRASVRRYFFLAPAFLVLGAVTIAWAASLSEALIWEFGGMGLLMIVTGVIALSDWLSRNPPQAESIQ